MNNYVGFVFAICSCLAWPCAGAQTGFDDLLTGSIFASGQVVASNGVEFEVFSPPGQSGSFSMRVGDAYPPTGSSFEGAFLTSFGGADGGLEFGFDRELSGITLGYAIMGSPGSLTINGEFRPASGGISMLSGEVIGGVAVDVEPGSDPRIDTGTLALSGAIRSFRMMGGNEFAVDWISTAVPEPACAVLAVVAAAGAAISGARRHRHASPGRCDYTCSGTTNGSR